MPRALARCEQMYLLSRGSGQPILFLHGMPTSCHLWDGIVERMLGNFTCIAVDLPGLGRSPADTRGFRQLGEMAASLEALRIRCKISQWHIVGHDAGCAIAIHYAHQFPERVGRLALLSPSIFPELKPFYLFEILRKPLLGEVMAPFVSLLFWQLAMRRALAGHENRNAAISDFHAPFMGVRGAWRLMSLLRWGDPAQVLAGIPALLPQLLAPTIIFHGSKDPAIPLDFAVRASGLIPNSQMMLFDSGHFLPMSEAATIASELLRFFGRSNQSAMSERIDARTPVAVGA